MQRSPPSSSIPSPPEQNIHYYNSSILVKGPHPASSSLDHVFPNPRPKTLGPDDRSSSSDYYHRRIHSNTSNYSDDEDASFAMEHNNINNKNGVHTRIDIANLLCTSNSSNGPTRNTTTTSNNNNTLPPPPPPHTTNTNSNGQHGHHHDPKSQAALQQGLRAITEEADDHEVSPHHRHRPLPPYPDSRNGNHSSNHYNSNGTTNGTTNGPYSSSSTGPSRESSNQQRVFAIDAPSAAPSSSSSSSTSYYRPPTSSSTSSSSHVGPRPASFSAGSTSSLSSSGPLYSSAGSSSSSSAAAIYTSAPSRSKLPGPQQRSASWNTDRYQDYGPGQGHSSSTSYEQEQQRRTDRSKSDYALHQQNYGPYLDSSPPLSAATLPRSNGTTTSSSSVSSSAPSSSGAKMPSSGAESPVSLYYQQPQPQQHQPQSQAPPSQQAQHQQHQQQQQQHSKQQPSASTSALSSSPSSYPYSTVPSSGGHGTPNSVRSLSTASMASSSSRSMRDYPHAQSSDNSANDQLRRPTLPPPAALLSGADVKPQRIYGRDSTVDELWPTHSRARVVPIDAPNEKRPFSFDGSAMLPPVLPPPTSSAPSSSSSSTLHSYSSGYSNGSMEQKQSRIYGIDAADVPSRFAAPPALPSYGPNGHYTKRPQESSDGVQGSESRKRVFGRDSADTYQQRAYGSNTAAPPASSAPSYSGSQPYVYNAPPPPPPQPSPPQNHHYSSPDMDRSSRYEEYKHRGWSNGQPASTSSSSSMAHGGPTYGSSNSTSSSRSYPRAQSPDIKPPSWYQDYANSVLPKPQTQPAYQQQRSDSGYYGGSNHHYQQQQHHHSSSHGYGKSSSLAGIHEIDEDDEGNHHRSKSSKRSKTGMGSPNAVHPFDQDLNLTSSSSSKSKKPKRIKNAAGQEDMIVMDDEFYAVKAKRKRANASQLSVLNAAFERSYFPSTEERLRLSKQCRMCPRTVQIWFQNKRQSVKARSEAMEAAVSGTAITDELLESRLQMLEEESGTGGSDGQKRSTGDMIEEDFEDDEESGPGEHGDHSAHRRHQHHHSNGSGSGSSKPRRSSGNTSGGSSSNGNGNGHMTPSDAVMSALHIQLDGRSVDYFSRKRRATIAKMERNEQQKKEKEELQRKREQEQQLIIQQYQKHQQEQLQQQRLQQQQHQHQEGQTVGHN
ncbi:hypothetical protein BGZ96_011979 [Linnemannia gamsii]|uniref:Homeobox domain-containing protein n=1 Tax=Linnemannia gamsii TaxID=64522 RepID=A0ABQ7JR81_9FUNG|nr:hypothetical protein BGZ96_011979 [Linnemannia gamsii]